MTNLKVNPEYEALWGKLPKPEYEALKDSIREDGLLEKIVVNPDLTILDGHQRHRVLQDLEVEVTREHYARAPSRFLSHSSSARVPHP